MAQEKLTLCTYKWITEMQSFEMCWTAPWAFALIDGAWYAAESKMVYNMRDVETMVKIWRNTTGYLIDLKTPDKVHSSKEIAKKIRMSICKGVPVRFTR